MAESLWIPHSRLPNALGRSITDNNNWCPGDKKLYDDAGTVIPLKLFSRCKTITYLETFNEYIKDTMH